MKKIICITLTVLVLAFSLLACGLPHEELDQYREKIDELKEQIYDNEQQHAEQLHELNQELNRVTEELEKFLENPNHELNRVQAELEQLQRDFYLLQNFDDFYRHRWYLPDELTTEHVRLDLFSKPEIIPFVDEILEDSLWFHSFTFVMSGGVTLNDDFPDVLGTSGIVVASASNRFAFADLLLEFVIDDNLNIEWTVRAYRVGHDNPWIVP